MDRSSGGCVPPPLEFAPARRGRLAYQAFGSGTETIVSVPPTAQNVEMAWEYPAIRRMLERFGSFCRFIHFDKRGTGCSDRHAPVPDVDARVDDLRSVMDAAGVERAHLFGSSEGGPMTLLFAATYPDRVASLMLWGTGPSLYPPDMSAAEIGALREHHRRYAGEWGTPASRVAAGMAPTLAAADPGFVEWHRRYERYAASADSLLDLLELSLHMDVREILPTLDLPALIMHRTDDPVVPIERGRELAEAMPNARMFEQPGGDHFAYAGDVDGWMDEAERLVTGAVRSTRVAVTARPTVRIVTLGRFAVEVDGVEVPTSAWGSRLARQLCKRLVAARGWPVTREELFDLLWPGETDRHVLGPRLSVQLSTVRRILRGGVIADRDSVRLDLGDVGTDLEDYYRADSDEAVVASYGGSFLPDDVYDDWTMGVREEVRSRFAMAAHRLAFRALAADRPDDAVALTHRLLEADPYDDNAHRLRVEALLTMGLAAEARRAHAAWTEAMQELGLEVPELEGLQPK